MSQLTLLWVLPLAGAAACLALGRFGRTLTRAAALAFSAAHFAQSLFVLKPFLAGGGAGLVAVGGERLAFGVSYLLAADGFSLSLIGLTAFLNLICILASWNLEVGSAYWANFLGLASALCGVFLARDLFVL